MASNLEKFKAGGGSEAVRRYFKHNNISNPSTAQYNAARAYVIKRGARALNSPTKSKSEKFESGRAPGSRRPLPQNPNKGQEKGSAYSGSKTGHGSTYTVSGVTYNRSTGKPIKKTGKGDTYTVNGITYNRDTGRPVHVPKDREPVKAKDRRGGGPAPAPEKSARQKEIESIRADKSLSNTDKWIKANRKMIESAGTQRQKDMLKDYLRRHSGSTNKPDANKVKKSNFGTKTGADTKKYEVKNKKRYDTSKVGGKFKKDLGIETGKYRVKSGNPKRRDTSKVKGSNFGRDTGVDTKKYDLPNKDANKDKLRFTTSKLKGIDTKEYSGKVKNKPNFADKLKKVTGKFTRK